ncbi:leucine--tRNA ligase [Candidatus Woesearchaeota archaeon]|nr:leucine--tRNA ligase [Candidatus Woesearchaeota archaeon]
MADFKELQKKWQEKWVSEGIFRSSPDSEKPKFYVLEMYPYPSGKLHMGHLRNYSIGDAFARYKRMNGFNVMYPMGYDAFGLPAENAAIKHKVHPDEWTRKCIEDMKQQQISLGLSYDWDRQIQSIDPEYYRWNQWIFLKMLEKGLAYKKAAPINWCPGCGTVLANEQVEDGKCWRCKSVVEEKNLEQWFFRITDYADRLLEDIDHLENWPDQVRVMQKNWIGKSYGTLLHFDVVDEDGNKIDTISTFTTRPDTVYGITYLVLAVEHPKVLEWTKDTDRQEQVRVFIQDVKKKSIIERTAEGREKNGEFLGRYFINPFTGDRCPLWVADYVLMEYGTGAVMAVPTHDQRDFEFAKKYDLPLKVVINPKDGHELDPAKMGRAFVDEGIMTNSLDFDGMNNRDAIEEISKFAESKGWGERTVNYKLRDWLISRQRYWGTPIPIIYCDKCGTVHVPFDQLPVRLPEDVEFTGEGNPLATSESFIKTECPKCGADARRETDTMDTFVDSSWYFLRYLSPKHTDAPFDKGASDYWMPVDQYIGGIEHAILHLLYARFFTKVLKDLGLTDVDEPFTRLLCQGMVTKDGAKMSKSLGNTVDPGPIIEKFGADTARLFILFAALPEKELEWSDQGVQGAYRFVSRVWRLIEEMPESEERDHNNADRHIISKEHSTIKVVTALIEDFKLSLAISNIMEFVNAIYKYRESKVHKCVYQTLLESLALMLAPFTPHIAEEIWARLGHEGEFISLQRWPSFDEGRIDADAEASEEMVSTTLGDAARILELARLETPSKLRLFIADSWKYDFVRQLKAELENTRDAGSILKSLMSGDMKVYGREISKLVPKLVKDSSKVPDVVLDQDKEVAVFEENRPLFEKQVGCGIEIIRAQDSEEPKAKQAMPGKPAILVE